MRAFKKILLFVLLSTSAVAQDDAQFVLDFENFMDKVKINHPLARQAEIQLLKGQANLSQTRGLFDPSAFADVAQKYFNDSQYYSQIDGGLKIPTWFGIELKSGYEQNQGVYLNPENNTPGGGLWYAGISVPVGQGLFIDKRRAELRKAQAYLEISETERQLLLNELLYNAGKSYWDWFLAYNNMLVLESALVLSEQRFVAVSQSATLGDRPFIDTLEAGIQVQNRKFGLLQARLDYNNATALLEVYLWDQGIVPLELSSETVPQKIEVLEVSDLEINYYGMLDSLVGSHPKMAQYSFKLQQLEVDKRWQQEQLKPKLNLNYNPISEPIGGNPFSGYSVNNYTWGLTFSMPILLRQERGNLQLANLRIEEIALDTEMASASLAYKAIAALNEWNTTKEQVEVYSQTVKDYASLLDGERQLFATGESSLFMVNSRELGYINAQIKYNDLVIKNKKASLETQYTFGTLWEN